MIRELALLNEVRDKFWKALSRGYISTISGLFPRSADDQMKASWASLVKPGDAIPDVFREFLESAQSEGREFPYAVLTPSYEGFIHREVEKLVCDFEHEIDVLERNGNSFRLQCYPLDRISCVQHKTTLLASSIKIRGMTKQDAPASSFFRYNTVTDCLFTPILHRMRHASVSYKISAHRSELAKFDPWRSVNLKFMNYARRSLLAEERVLYKILQPEIREPWHNFFGKTCYRTVSPTLASILTDKELIMIREDRWGSGDDRYGGIWDFLPLNKIMRLSSSETDNGLLEFSIHLTDGHCLNYLFQSSAKREIDRLRDRFLELIVA